MLEVIKKFSKEHNIERAFKIIIRDYVREDE